MLLKYFYIPLFVLLLTCACSCNLQSSKNTPDTAQKMNPVPSYKPIESDTVNGLYQEFYSNGNIKLKGFLKDGKREGDWSYFYENGKLWSRGEYTKGLRNGISNVYYENGVKKIDGNYVDDVPKGVWTFYNMEGKIIKEVTR